jgi:GxxExxY protein
MESDIFKLCDLIREAAFQLYSYLRHGHLEKVYENGMSHRLALKGIEFCQQYPLKPIEGKG